MFTGLVESAGTVVSLTPRGDSAILKIESATIADSAKTGASIAVNGCCLTVTSLRLSELAFDVGNETLARTTIGRLQPGDHVNLERAIAAGDPMGGHYVTGHIDAVIELLERRDNSDWSTCWFRLPEKFAAQVVPQGSVALDGISLTVVDVQADRFSIMFVPHTLSVTTMGQRKPRDAFNLETDVLAKYVERQLAALRKGA